MQTATKSAFQGSRLHTKAAHVSRNDRHCRTCKNKFDWHPFLADDSECDSCSAVIQSRPIPSVATCKYCDGTGLRADDNEPMHYYCECDSGAEREAYDEMTNGVNH